MSNQDSVDAILQRSLEGLHRSYVSAHYVVSTADRSSAQAYCEQVLAHLRTVLDKEGSEQVTRSVLRTAQQALGAPVGVAETQPAAHMPALELCHAVARATAAEDTSSTSVYDTQLELLKAFRRHPDLHIPPWLGWALNEGVTSSRTAVKMHSLYLLQTMAQRIGGIHAQARLTEDFWVRFLSKWLHDTVLDLDDRIRQMAVPDVWARSAIGEILRDLAMAVCSIPHDIRRSVSTTSLMNTAQLRDLPLRFDYIRRERAVGERVATTELLQLAEVLGDFTSAVSVLCDSVLEKGGTIEDQHMAMRALHNILAWSPFDGQDSQMRHLKQLTRSWEEYATVARRRDKLAD